jgi:hypothetical protein
VVIVAGTSWTGGKSLGSLPSETVVAAVAGASARTLLSWISEKLHRSCSFLLTFTDVAARGYSFLKILTGILKVFCKVLDGYLRYFPWAGMACFISVLVSVSPLLTGMVTQA